MSRLSTKQRRARRVRNAAIRIDTYLKDRPDMLHYGLCYWPERLWADLMCDGSWEGQKPGLSYYHDCGETLWRTR